LNSVSPWTTQQQQQQQQQQLQLQQQQNNKMSSDMGSVPDPKIIVILTQCQTASQTS